MSVFVNQSDNVSLVITCLMDIFDANLECAYLESLSC